MRTLVRIQGVSKFYPRVHKPGEIHHMIGMQMAEKQPVQISWTAPGFEQATETAAAAIELQRFVANIDKVARGRAVRVGCGCAGSQQGDFHPIPLCLVNETARILSRFKNMRVLGSPERLAQLHSHEGRS